MTCFVFRQYISEVIAKKESDLNISSKKHTQALSENKELREHIEKQECKLMEQGQKAENCKTRLGKMEKDIHLMRLFFEEFRGKLDSNMVNISHKMMQASGSLQLLDARLQSASQRVQLASTLMAQKKVRDRNSTASAVANEVGALSAESVMLDNLGSSLESLAPEAEGLLCSIFRQMDPHDSGCVSIQLFIECLLHQDGALLQLVNSALGGGALPLVLTGGLGKIYFFSICR